MVDAGPRWATSSPYSALAGVYDRWSELDGLPRQRWLQFIRSRFERARPPIRRVVDIGCGTGVLTRLLQDEGMSVTGVDASMEMLSRARSRAEPGTSLVRMRLPDDRFRELGRFDAGVMCFDSANYLVGDGELERMLSLVSAVMAPGGVLVFDVSTRLSFESIAAMGDFGEDLGDFSYTWRTLHRPDSPRYTYVVGIDDKHGGPTPPVEVHEQRWFDPADIASALQGAGFVDVRVSDDYTDRGVTDDTRRETWVAVSRT